VSGVHALVPALVPAALLAALAVLAGGRGAGARRRLRSAFQAGSHRTGRDASGFAVDDPAVAALADLVAAVARAGLPPARTWALVATGPGGHASVAAGAARWSELGLPSGTALLRSAAGSDPRPGARARGRGPARRDRAGRGPAPPPPPLVALAVALDVCDRAGAPTSEVLAGLARALRAQEAARQDREVALAAPRATATVMGLLPVAGLALGLLLGVNPAAVLLLTPVGRVCFVVGLGLWTAGRWWMHRLVEAAAVVPS
jgi:tight adherence protein B